MTDDVVAEDQWGQIIFYDQWNTLGLKLRRPADGGVTSKFINTGKE